MCEIKTFQMQIQKLRNSKRKKKNAEKYTKQIPNKK